MRAVQPAKFTVSWHCWPTHKLPKEPTKFIDCRTRVTGSMPVVSSWSNWVSSNSSISPFLRWPTSINHVESLTGKTSAIQRNMRGLCLYWHYPSLSAFLKAFCRTSSWLRSSSVDRSVKDFWVVARTAVSLNVAGLSRLASRAEDRRLPQSRRLPREDCRRHWPLESTAKARKASFVSLDDPLRGGFREKLFRPSLAFIHVRDSALTLGSSSFLAVFAGRL